MERNYPLQEPDTEKRRAEEQRRREYERKFGYMQNIDGITEITYESKEEALRQK